MGEQYRCDECGYEGDADDHGCPGSPFDRLDRVEADVAQLREDVTRAIEAMQAFIVEARRR